MCSLDEELTASGTSRRGFDSRGFEGRELQRVIPVQAHLGEGLILVSLELYADGIALRWLLSSANDAGLPIPLELSDNRGNVYEEAGSGWFGAGAVRGESLFRPTVPAEADALMIGIGGSRITVRL